MSQPPVARNRKWLTILLVYSVGIATALLYITSRTDVWPDQSREIPRSVPHIRTLTLTKASEGSFEHRVNTAISVAIRLVGEKREWIKKVEIRKCLMSAVPTENGEWLIKFEQLSYIRPSRSVNVIVGRDGSARIDSEDGQ